MGFSCFALTEKETENYQRKEHNANRGGKISDYIFILLIRKSWSSMNCCNCATFIFHNDSA